MVEGFEDYFGIKPARDHISRDLFGALTGDVSAQGAYVADKAVEGVWLHPLVDTVMDVDYLESFTPAEPLVVGVDLPLLARAPLQYLLLPELFLSDLPDFSIGL